MNLSTACRCSCDPLSRDRVEVMLRSAKTKDQLQELVGMLDHQNVRLRALLHQARLNNIRETQ